VRSLVSGNEQDVALAPDAHATLHQSVIGAPAPTQPASATAAGTLAWLTGRLGLACNRAVAGPVPSWALREPTAVIDASDGTPRGWSRQWGVRSVVARDGALVARVRGRARLALERAWDLTDDTRGQAFVLELGGGGLARVRVRVLSAEGLAGEPTVCALGASAQEYAYTVLELAPGRYAGFVLDVESADGDGELVIASWSLVAMEALPR
jgi:hypothetical protein